MNPASFPLACISPLQKPANFSERGFSKTRKAYAANAWR
jgi:hypothetical protein